MKIINFEKKKVISLARSHMKWQRFATLAKKIEYKYANGKTYHKVKLLLLY